MDTLNLSGKAAIVTGGGTGIGRAIAINLAGQGMKVAVAGRRTEPLEETVAAITSTAGTAMAVPADVTERGDVDQLVAEVAKRSGNPYLLVNNAGIGGSAPIHRHDADVWEKVLAVNLTGPFLMARYCLPLMRQQGEGHIVNISSESGLEYHEGNGAYGVSKHALNALAEFIQRENQDLGIRVDTVCPGMVVTPMSKGSPGLNEEQCLYPEDIADLVGWLVSRRPNVKIGRPILIQTMVNPWGG